MIKLFTVSFLIVSLFFSCGGEVENIDDDIEISDMENDDSRVDTTNMVTVPAGDFWMGCNKSDKECEEDEKPYHKVFLKEFKIDIYEVTSEEFDKCLKAENCGYSSLDENTFNNGPKCNRRVEGKERHPMNCVSWFGAKRYCEWVGKRLPTEAEWEKAARGTDGRIYPWGNEEVGCDYAVIAQYDDERTDGCGTESTWVVGSKENGKSPYGAYDMIGNVWEWVADWYDEEYFAESSSSNPAGPDSGDFRVLKGGSYYYDTKEFLRISNRYYDYNNNTDYTYGFRCAK